MTSSSVMQYPIRVIMLGWLNFLQREREKGGVELPGYYQCTQKPFQ